MKSLIKYILEDNNLENVQNKIDDIKPNSTNQIKNMTPDSIKSFLINNDELGNIVTIVSIKDDKFIIKFSKDVFIENNNISDKIIKICKYFKEVFGATDIKIDNKKYILNVSK